MLHREIHQIEKLGFPGISVQIQMEILVQFAFVPRNLRLSPTKLISKV